MDKPLWRIELGNYRKGWNRKMGKRGPMAKNRLPTTTDMAQGMPMEKPSAEMRRYRAEDALRDIERAEGHKRNATLMKDVKGLAKEKVESLKKVCKE